MNNEINYFTVQELAQKHWLNYNNVGNFLREFLPQHNEDVQARTVAIGTMLTHGYEWDGAKWNAPGHGAVAFMTEDGRVARAESVADMPSAAKESYVIPLMRRAPDARQVRVLFDQGECMEFVECEDGSGHSISLHFHQRSDGLCELRLFDRCPVDVGVTSQDHATRIAGWNAHRWHSNPDSFHMSGPGGISCDVEASDESEHANYLRVLAESLEVGLQP